MGTATKTRGRRGAKSSLVAETVQKPTKQRGPELAPLIWLEGQREDGTWVPLYCSRRRAMVKAWYRAIFELDDDHPRIVKEGLDVYEDFRVRGEDE